MHSAGSVRRPWFALAALLTLLAACGGEPDVPYEGPFQAEVRRAIPRIEQGTGLKFKEMPVLELRDRDQVRAFLDQQFAEQLTPLELAGLERTYKRFGLLPDSMDLRAYLLDLLTEQVAGYYDPATRVLYVVEGGDPTITSSTVVHELVHALQHQHFELDTVKSLKGDNDRQVALQTMIEGQATYEMMVILVGGTDFGMRLPGGWDAIRENIRAEQEKMPVFANAPVILRETVLFPYLSGAEFIRQHKRLRPGTQPYDPPPASTEQILHPEKYTDSLPDLPTRVTLPAPRFASLVHEDNLGEFETRLFLYEHLRDVGRAAQAAAGWDGDRYQLVQTPQGEGLVWFTVWDSALDAAEFRDALERSVERRFGVAPRSGGSGDSRRWTARGRQLMVRAAEHQGRPVVIWEDLPRGARSGVLDLDRVGLSEN